MKAVVIALVAVVLFNAQSALCQQQIATQDSNIIITTANDVIVTDGEREISIFGDVSASISSLISQNVAANEQISVMASQIASLTAETQSNADGIANAQSTADAASLNSGSALLSTETSLRNSIASASSSLESEISDVAAGAEEAATSNAADIAHSADVAAVINSHVDALQTRVNGIPRFYVSRFYRDCGTGNYVYIDADNKEWQVPGGLNTKNVNFDAETKSGLAYFPRSGSTGFKLFFALPGSRGISCRWFPNESDWTRGWDLLEATDGGNNVNDVWGVDGVRTYFFEVINPYCSPADIQRGVCTHPADIHRCISATILCYQSQ